MLPVGVLLTEQELAEGLIGALAHRFLPEKYFYWLPLSVRAWLDLCQETQPYRNFFRSYRLVADHAADIAERCASSGQVVSLGAAQGDKDLLLLEASRAHRRQVTYQPVDASQSLLELGLRRALDAGFAARGLKADLADPRTMARLELTASTPRLYLILGNTLGALDPIAFLTTLRSLLRSSDLLLVDGEIFSSQDTMAGYDNPVNRRFAFAPLASLGLVEGNDASLVFEQDEDPRLAGLFRVTKHARVLRHLEVVLAGHRVVFAAGEHVNMHCSYKYARETLMGLLRQIGGLTIEAEYLSPDQRFVMALTRKE